MTIARSRARGMDGALRRLFVEGSLAGMGDAELLERFVARGDGAAFEALVRRHGPAVWAACRAVLRDDHDAEDAFQATFIILARRAPALWTAGGSLGCWLHKVAHRVSARLIADASRRRARERRVATSAIATEPTSADDLRAAVHREVARLPERFRRPVVLCHLEGLTHAQAAAELSQGEATVRRRLAEAKALLRSRLERRGLAPAVGLLGLLGASRTQAAVPEALAIGAARAACGVVLGRVAMSPAAALGTRVLRGMLLARMMPSAALIVVAAGLATAVVATSTPARRSMVASGELIRAVEAEAQEAAGAAIDERPEGERAEDDAFSGVVVAGRILGPDGAPAPVASVVFYQISPYAPGPPAAIGQARCDSDGAFRMEVDRAAIRGHDREDVEPIDEVLLAAFADGYGPAWVSSADPAALRDVTLRLVSDDVPIDGRIIDLEGRAVPGVSVRPQMIMAARGEDLGAMLRGEGDPNPVDLLIRPYLDARIVGLPDHVVTDADGRFRLEGIGRERVTLCTIEGPTIASGQFYAMTRPGPEVTIEGFLNDNPTNPPRMFLGATFEYAVEPTVPIVGVVRDEKTGEPLPGVRIHSNRGLSSAAETDAEGRYRLIGVSKGDEYRVAALPGQMPYLGALATVGDGPGLEPRRVDFALRRGVRLRVRLVDQTSGEPIRGEVAYYPYRDNPHSEGLTGFDAGYSGREWNRVRVSDENIYTIVVPPGRGLLVGTSGSARCIPGCGADRVTGVDVDGFAPVLPFSIRPEDCESVAEIDLPADSEEVSLVLEFDQGRAVRGTLLDPEGRPLTGAAVAALTSGRFPMPEVRASSSFVATGLSTDHPRTIIARHEGRSLGGVLVLRGEEEEPVRFRLEPLGGLTGRLIDLDGLPLGGAALLQARDPSNPFAFLSLETRPRCDAEGRFRIEGLVPGLAYFFEVEIGGRSIPAIRGATIRPGEVSDLGDVRVRPVPRSDPAAIQNPSHGAVRGES